MAGLLDRKSRATRWALLIGPHIEWSAVLGQRTSEMHQALASDPDDPAFAPEPFTAIERQALVHAARISCEALVQCSQEPTPRSPLR